MTTLLTCGPRTMRGRYMAAQRNWSVKQIGLVIARAIDDGGVDHIISGGALGPDQIGAAAALYHRDRKGAAVRVTIARPCPSQDAKWNRYEQQHYADLCRRADKVVTLGDDPCTAAKYHQRNR